MTRTSCIFWPTELHGSILYADRQPVERLDRPVLETAFPYFEYAPPCVEKLAPDLFVPLCILQKLVYPEFSVRFWCRGVPAAWMAMPETTMNKNTEPVLGQDKVRLSRQVTNMQSVPKTTSMKILSQSHLRSRIFSANAGHHPGAGLSVDDIHNIN